MFIFSLNYIKPISEVEQFLSEHIQYLEKYYTNKKFICSGRKVPRTGGIILCNCATKQEAEQIIKEDPFFKQQIAQYEIIEFIPSKSLELFISVKYDEIVEIDENIKVRFNDAGHMLGSSVIELWTKEEGKETKTIFTGDLGNNDIPLLDSPTMIEKADYLVMESTYGSRLHLRNDEKAELFLDIVSETLDNGGSVVIPSFAVRKNTRDFVWN